MKLKILCFYISLFIVQITSSQTFRQDGINYNIIDTEKVEVIAYTLDKIPGDYTGDIYIPNTVIQDDVTYSVVAIGDKSFRSCWSLTSVRLPDNLERIGDSAFESCEALTSIDIPVGVTSIGNNAFMECGSFTTINLPENLRTLGEGSFASCGALTSIDLPNKLTSISGYNFYGCSNLSTVKIPASVNNIEKSAFGYCTNLESVKLCRSEPLSILSEVFTLTNITSVTLYVPEGTTSSYQNASVWKNFGSMLEEDCPEDDTIVDEDDKTDEETDPSDKVENGYTVSQDFERILLERGYDTDGELNGKFVPSEGVSLLKTLNISNENLKSIEGIEYFTSLEILEASKNDLETVDLSKNLNLTKLDLDHNKVKILNISTLSKLEYLSVKENGTLKEIILDNNQELKYLYASFNQLEIIDLTEAKNLIEIELNDNQLTGSIDLSEHILVSLYNFCNNNLDNFPDNNCAFGYKELFATKSQFESLEAFMVFRGWDLDTEENGIITPHEGVKYIKVLDLKYVGLDNINGIQHFTSLEKLFLTGNRLTTVDLTNNTALEVLTIEGNYLEGLDISKNINLNEVDASNNQLAIVNFKNTNNTSVSNENFKLNDNNNLSCVVVDDVAYSLHNWTMYVDDPSVFTSFNDCYKPNRLSDDDIEIEGKKIVKPSYVSEMKIYSESGEVIENKNLEGLYFVLMIDDHGKAVVRKVLIFK